MGDRSRRTAGSQKSQLWWEKKKVSVTKYLGKCQTCVHVSELQNIITETYFQHFVKLALSLHHQTGAYTYMTASERLSYIPIIIFISKGVLLLVHKLVVVNMGTLLFPSLSGPVNPCMYVSVFVNIFVLVPLIA